MKVEKFNSITLREEVTLKKIIMLLIVILVLTACAKRVSNDYKFKGESEHWKPNMYIGERKCGRKITAIERTPTKIAINFY